MLGVDIDYRLKFEQHISNICRKASQQLNAVRRIGFCLSRLNKITLYYTFILSNFNFCPLAWHFCNKTCTRKLEKIQERALRFIYDDHTSSYESLLERINLPSLHVRRMRNLAMETFKILHDLSPPCLSDLVKFKNCTYNFRYKNVLEIPKVRTVSYGLNSFRYTSAVLWNSLPSEFRQESSFSQFKNLIQNWNGNNCPCNICK